MSRLYIVTLLENKVKVIVTQLFLTLCNPMGCSLPGSSVRGILQLRILDWIAIPFFRVTSQLLHGIFPTQGLKRSPTLQVSCLLTEPPGKPKNTGVDSLSLLQGIFLTQESNQGLLHCRWILYQLSYQGSLLLNARLNEAQAGIKTAERNINNLRYADDTTPQGRK